MLEKLISLKHASEILEYAPETNFAKHHRAKPIRVDTGNIRDSIAQ
jgi:hypothetical protein